MFLIDDSGSMLADAKGDYHVRDENKKINIAKSALKQVLAQYKDQFNWGLQTLHNNPRYWNGMRKKGKRIMLFTHMQNCLDPMIPKVI